MICANKSTVQSENSDAKNIYFSESFLKINDVDFKDVANALKSIRLKNVKNIIIGQLNINTIENKIDFLRMFVVNNIDILIITESKLDDSYPTAQFTIEGYKKPFRLDRNKDGGGILIFVREDIPSTILDKHKLPKDIEGLFVEINFRKSKLLLFGTYHPPSQSDNYYFNSVSKALLPYLGIYDRILLCGDFNAQVHEPVLNDFLITHGLKCIVNDKTCFKSLINPSTVDLFLTNSPKSFQNTCAVSTGISDFHKMVITVMKTTFEKSKPKIITYRSYKNFNEEFFRLELKNKLDNTTNEIDFKNFQNIFLSTLNKHAPLKKRSIRANEVPYINGDMRRAIMTRSRLEHAYQKNRTIENYNRYKKHRNFCNRLNYRSKRAYYSNLDDNKITDVKTFWKTVKPFLTDKGANKNKRITLIKDDTIISDDQGVADTLNSFFERAVQSLDIKEPTEYINDCSHIEDPIDAIIEKFKDHPSIKSIRANVEVTAEFNFQTVTLEMVQDEIKALNPKKSNPTDNITASDIKKYSDLCSAPLLNIINNCISNNTFDEGMKNADLTPVHKKDKDTDEKTYRPVSGLPAGSKIFERIMHKQIGGYIEKFLSPFLCGYRKNYSSQHALLALIEKWRIILDKKGYGGAILMDLSKAFDTLNHDLIIAKLHAYGFSKSALKLVRSYLTNRWQRTKVNNSFSAWVQLLTGVPQGSIVGPLFFNIDLNDIFYLEHDCDVCSFADDTTPYACDEILENLIDKLVFCADKFVEWFEINYMKVNPEKFHLLISGRDHDTITLNIGGEVIVEKHAKDLLGVTLDTKLSFNEHVKSICKKAGTKLNALSRICKILPFRKRRQLVISFFHSNFKYCPLVWMSHSRELNAKINALHYRALKIVYRDDDSTFESLLEKDNSHTVHNKNIHTLAIEMFKCKSGISPIFMNEIFVLNQNLDRDNVSSRTRSKQTFYNYKNPRSTKYGLDAIRNLGPQIWNILPTEIKNLDTIKKFKSEIKKWRPLNCPCRLCKEFVPGLGFLN